MGPRIFTSVLSAFALFFVGAETVSAETLAGSWSGRGYIHLSSGGREPVRCRLAYRETRPDTYRMTGRCASTSGRSSVSGTVQKSGPFRFTGQGYSPSYGVTGTVAISLRGRTHSLTVRGGGGSARLTLNR